LKTRIEKWKDTTYILSFLAGKNKKRLDQISKWQVESTDESHEDQTSMSNFNILGACKELIFNIKDGELVFHAIMYAIDTDKITIKLEHALDVLIDNSASEQEIDEEIRNTLALASAQDVPVYANSKNLVAILEKHHRNMLIDGFTAPDGTGQRVKLKLSRSISGQLDNPNILNELDLTEYHAPADLSLIKSVITKELSRLHNVSLLLANLEIGIKKLEKLLSFDKRNENSIQKCWLCHR